MLLFFFTAPSPTDSSTLSLHDALPICFSDRDCFDRSCKRSARDAGVSRENASDISERQRASRVLQHRARRQAGKADRKSTRLNSSHMSISYAVFCLKKKKNTNKKHRLI